MKIKIIPCLKDNYSYLLIDDINNTSCVIDPSEATPVAEILDKNNIKLDFILNTHHHYDHVGGNKKLKEKYNAKVIGFIEDKKRIPEIDIALQDNQIWKHKNFKAKVSDFGASKASELHSTLANSTTAATTRRSSNSHVGTAAWMAPDPNPNDQPTTPGQP